MDKKYEVLLDEQAPSLELAWTARWFVRMHTTILTRVISTNWRTVSGSSKKVDDEAMTLRPRFDELKATGQLPSPTGVALAILRLAESEDTTTQAISQVLQTDPALAGRILKIANSATLGRSRPMTAIQDAVTYLGTRLTRNVALGFSLVSQHGQGACREFDYRRFWSRSLIQGVAAQAGASRIELLELPEAFTCGLLAQVGRLALATVYPEVYGQILTKAREVPEELCRLEREHLAIDHNQVTASLLQDWGLPATCIDAAQHHENPEASGFIDDGRNLALASLLHRAGFLADVCVGSEEERPAKVRKLFAAGEAIGLTVPEQIFLCDRVVAEWHEWGTILEVQTQAVPKFGELVVQARQHRKPEEALSGFVVKEEARITVSPEEKMTGGPVIEAGGTPILLKVVVIDDDRVERMLLQRHLTAAGHQVHLASNGIEGLRLVLDVNPHLVVTDLVMPGMDGVALCKTLRQTKIGRQLYLIMLTSTEEEQSQVEAFDAGADDFLIKPFRPRILLARLRACQRLLSLQEEVRYDKERLDRCMAELGIANRKLQQMALTDTLTGLNNRRYALDRLDQEWAVALRTHQALSCMMIDIDHFKCINDTYGHDVGDLVLHELAEVMHSTLRRNDVACRFGGEEFLVICPATDQEGALILAERLRTAVEEHAFNSSLSLHATVSVGLGMRAPWMIQPADLLKAADQGLYAAKRNGRNRVSGDREPFTAPN